MKPITTIVMTALMCFAAIQTQAADITFTSDAVVQEGDTYGNVYVYSPQPEHTTVDMTGGTARVYYLYDASTVNVLGGYVTSILTYDSSTLNLSRRISGSVFAYDSSTINLYRGTDVEWIVFLYGNTSLNVYEGGVSPGLLAYGNSSTDLRGGIISTGVLYDSSTFNMSSGRIYDLLAYDSTTINVTDGTIEYQPYLYDEVTMNMSGGSSNSFIVAGSSILNFSGGEVYDRIAVTNSGTVHLSGGVVNHICAYESSAVHIYGFGFEYEPTGSEFYSRGLYAEGVLTGFWGDGTPFSMDLLSSAWNYGSNYTYPHLVFHVIPGVLGDADLDGDVDLVDLGTLAGNYDSAGEATWTMGDFDGDGDVDLVDLGMLANNYGKGTDGTSLADFDSDYDTVLSNVPEPATLCLLVMGAFAFLRRKQR